MSGVERSFRKAGRGLRCRACFVRRSAHSHHVLHEQELRKRGLPAYDLRNVMGLCFDCHFAHHNRSKVIPLALLSTQNVEYAFEALGAYAYDWLRQHYGGEDERVEIALERQEWLT